MSDVTEVIREVQEFELNGWTIRPCPEPGEDGFDLVHDGERYHYDDLEPAVAAAQASPRYAPKHIDTDESVFALHDSMEYTDFTALIFRGQTVHRLIQRIERYEKNKPSWLNGTPEDVDAWLRDLIPDDKRLAFYQWIGAMAVGEAIADVREDVDNDPTPVEHRYYTQQGVHEFLDVSEESGPYPAQLPIGKPFCDDPAHDHTHGGTRLPTCSLGNIGWPEE